MCTFDAHCLLCVGLCCRLARFVRFLIGEAGIPLSAGQSLPIIHSKTMNIPIGSCGCIEGSTEAINVRRIGEESWLWRLMEGSVSDWLGFGAGFAALLVLIWLSFLIRSWLRDDAGPEADSHQMLTQLGDLLREGDLSEEEYRSIKSRLIERLDDSSRGDDTHLDDNTNGSTENDA